MTTVATRRGNTDVRLCVCKSGVSEHRPRRQWATGGRSRIEGVGDNPAPGRREITMPGTLTRPELTAADRCDRCGAAAKLRAVLPSGGELLFCGHHGREFEPRLREMEAELQQDEQ